MGRLFSSLVIGVECNLCDCGQRAFFRRPFEKNAQWWEHVEELDRLHEAGWSFVFSKRLRAYCPFHAAFAFRHTCQSRRKGWKGCVVCAGRVEELVWASYGDEPLIVREFRRMANRDTEGKKNTAHTVAREHTKGVDGGGVGGNIQEYGQVLSTDSEGGNDDSSPAHTV